MINLLQYLEKQILVIETNSFIENKNIDPVKLKAERLWIWKDFFHNKNTEPLQPDTLVIAYTYGLIFDVRWRGESFHVKCPNIMNKVGLIYVCLNLVCFNQSLICRSLDWL